MDKYEVEITQEVKYNICVWANSEAEAIEQALQDKRLEEHDFDKESIEDAEVVCIWGSL